MIINNKKKNREYSLLKGKKILLCMPDHFSIYENFSQGMKEVGMDLKLILPPNFFHYRKKKEKIINFLRKTFLLDKKYKNKLRRQFDIDCYKEWVKDIPEKSLDYVLIIRPDLIPQEALQALLRLGKKTIGYQWDGLNIYSEVFACIPMFDTFYVFDPEDYQKYKETYSNLRLTHNFFFEGEEVTNKTYRNEGVFYRGSYSPSLIEDTTLVVNELAKYDVFIDVQLLHYKDKRPTINNRNIGLFDQQIDFGEYLEMVKNAKILLDFKAIGHNGLSLRFFESLKYEKKLITNNTSVVDYDFYNPNNIFILHKDSLEDLEKFIRSDYEKLPTEVVESYSFKAWLYDCLLG